VLLTLTNRPPDTYRLVPDVILPGGVRLLSMSTDTLLVRLFRSPR
jgi:hypothetical protein